jgi:hypothetical protein
MLVQRDATVTGTVHQPALLRTVCLLFALPVDAVAVCVVLMLLCFCYYNTYAASVSALLCASSQSMHQLHYAVLLLP